MTAKINQSDVWDRFYSEGIINAAKTDRQALDNEDFTSSKYLYKKAIVERLIDRSDADWYVPRLFQSYIPKNRAVGIAIGSGLCALEFFLLENSYVEKLHVFETSQIAVSASLAEAKKRGLEHKIVFHNRPLQHCDFDDCSVDIVLANASLHHVFDLENLFDSVHKFLVPNGFLFFDEYIGPDYMQYSEKKIELLNRFNACLPAELKKTIASNGSSLTRDVIKNVDLEWQLKTDPSEGVHSSLIMNNVKKLFTTLYLKYNAGTLLRPIFQHILSNFDFNNSAHRSIADLLILSEQILVDNCVIDPDYVVYIGQKAPLDNFS